MPNKAERRRRRRSVQGPQERRYLKDVGSWPEGGRIEYNSYYHEAAARVRGSRSTIKLYAERSPTVVPRPAPKMSTSSSSRRGF